MCCMYFLGHVFGSNSKTIKYTEKVLIYLSSSFFTSNPIKQVSRHSDNFENVSNYIPSFLAAHHYSSSVTFVLKMNLKNTLF